MIKALKDFNPYADITTTYSEDITLSYINTNPKTKKKWTKKTTEQVFIEPEEKCPDFEEELDYEGM